MKVASLMVIAHCLSVSAALATDRLVPGQYATIQAAIEAAADGDTVIVEPGTYQENIRFGGKAIMVRSRTPHDWQSVKATVIDGGAENGISPRRARTEGGGGSCVTFDAGEGVDSILEGFTLTNGGGTPMVDPHDPSMNGKGGGGIFCHNSSPTIRRCHIAGSGSKSYVDYGGGIALVGDTAASIADCLIVNNTVRYYGAGIVIASDTPETAESTISHCTIAGNEITLEEMNLDFELDAGNTRPTITHTIVYGNNGRGLLTGDLSRVTYSCVGTVSQWTDNGPIQVDPCDFTAAGGNISESPRFICAHPLTWEQADYHLRPQSPCINAGDPGFVGDGLVDLDGQPRVMGQALDLGADEFQPSITVVQPTAGDIWSTGSTRQVTWTSAGYGKPVDILFSHDTSSTGQILAKDHPDNGRFLWDLPDGVISDQCIISVVPGDSDDDIVTVDSGHFSIAGDWTGPPVASRWPSLGGNFSRTGLSPNDGLADGGTQWRYDTDGSVINSVTVGHEGRIHVACEDGTLLTLSPDGDLLWTLNINTSLLSAPSIGPDGSLFVGSTAGRLYAVTAEGQVRWTHGTGDPIYASAAIDSNGRVYVGSSDGTLSALGADGSQLWQFTTKGPASLKAGAIFTSPTIGPDGTIYIGGIGDPNLYALNPTDGTVKWACNFQLAPENIQDPDSPLTGGLPFTCPVVGSDGTIYQTLLHDSHLYAIEPETGTIRWSVDLLETLPIGTDPEWLDGCGDGWSEPALGPHGTIYVSLDDPYLRAVDPNGTVKWMTRLGQMGGFTLTVDRTGVIYAACDDGQLYVVAPDGSSIGYFATDGWSALPVIADDGTIIVTDSKDNSLLITEAGNAVQALSAESLTR